MRGTKIGRGHCAQLQVRGMRGRWYLREAGLNYPKELGWSHYLFSLHPARRWYMHVFTFYNELLLSPHVIDEAAEAQKCGQDHTARK